MTSVAGLEVFGRGMDSLCNPIGDRFGASGARGGGSDDGENLSLIDLVTSNYISEKIVIRQPQPSRDVTSSQVIRQQWQPNLGDIQPIVAGQRDRVARQTR